MHHTLKQKNTLSTILLVVFVVSTLLSTFSVAPTVTFASQGEQLSDVNDAITKDANANTNLDFGCFGGTPSSSMIAGCTAAGAYYLLFKPAYWLANWMSYFFNVAFTKLVVGMGHLVNSISGVDVAWTTLRDVGNIFLVFLLVYVGIATILGISGYGYKQLLWRIVLAALLVNFSITFAKVVIDVSNVLAIEMYQVFLEEAYNGVSVTTTSGSTISGSALAALCSRQGTSGAALDSTEEEACTNYGISAAFWTKLKFTSTFNVNDTVASTGSATDKQWKMALTALMGAVMSLVMAFVFGAAALLLVGRFIILVFLIVVSPVALIAWITKISSSGSKWWSSLLNQSMFAPLILLMWYVAYQIIGTTTPVAGTLSNASIIDGASIGIVLNFIMGMGFLIAGLVIAKQFGAYGASAVMKTGQQWSRRGAYALCAGSGALTVGAAGYAGRQTVGRAANRLNDSEALKQGATSKNFVRRTLSRNALNATKKVSDSSFDARTLSKSKTLGKAGGKGGFNKWAKDAQKKEEDIHKHASDYKGTHAERKAQATETGKVTAQQKKDDKIFKKEEKLAKKQEAQALKQAMHAQTDEERQAAEATLAKARRQQDVNTELKKTYDTDRAAERAAINKKYKDQYEDKGKERAKMNLDSIEKDKTEYDRQTTQWKKDSAASLRKSQGKTKEEKLVDMLNEVVDEKSTEKTKAAASETPSPDATPENK